MLKLVMQQLTTSCSW